MTFQSNEVYSFKGADSKVYEIHFTIILKDVVSCQKFTIKEIKY